MMGATADRRQSAVDCRLPTVGRLRNRRREPRRPVVGPRPAVGVDLPQQHRLQLRIDPGLRRARVRRVDREPLDEFLPRHLRRPLEDLQVRPGRLRVDVVGRHGRDAAPVVDPGVDERPQRADAQVRRRLDVHLRREQQPRHRDGPQVLVERCRRRVRHARAGLGPEVLDDDFLEVAVRLVQRSQREQRLDAFEPGLADPDQDAGGERDSQFAGHPNRREPHGRVLVGRSVVRAARLAQPRRSALEHDPLRDGDPPQRRQLAGVHASGVRVRQKPGLLEDETGRFGQVRNRRGMAEAIELAASRRVAKLGLVAQSEEDFLAVEPPARLARSPAPRRARGTRVRRCAEPARTCSSGSDPDTAS